MTWPTRQQILAAAGAAVAEDLALGDVTTAALLPAACPARATIVAREEMTVAGIAVARQVFREVDAAVRVVRALKDGSRIKRNTAVLIVEGDGRSLLGAERAAVNFLQHLSGVATLTHKFCAAVRGYRAQIVDTRKTLPGLRTLEKWAVALGGGRTHRQSLGDGILIKDNHLALLRAGGIGPAEACRLARQRAPHGLRIIMEAQALLEVREAVEGGADVILLDNMTAQQVREASDLIKGRALIEVSGGITLQNVAEMAAAGADLISIGALTHSAPAVDLSMDIAGLTPTRKRRVHGVGR